MPNERTLTLWTVVADGDKWLQSAGEHYRQLARCIRGVAVICRLPSPQRELLNLARRYERRAEDFELEQRSFSRAAR